MEATIVSKFKSSQDDLRSIAWSAKITSGSGELSMRKMLFDKTKWKSTIHNLPSSPNLMKQTTIKHIFRGKIMWCNSGVIMFIGCYIWQCEGGEWVLVVVLEHVSKVQHTYQYFSSKFKFVWECFVFQLLDVIQMIFIPITIHVIHQHMFCALVKASSKG